MSSFGSCYIYGLPDVCRDCKRVLAFGEPRLTPALCYPTATVDDIKDLPVRALINPQLVRRRLKHALVAIERRRRLDRAHSPAVNDLPAEPTTPHSEVINSSPPEHEVAEDADESWRIIQRVLDDSAWDDPSRSGM